MSFQFISPHPRLNLMEGGGAGGSDEMQPFQ